MSVRERYEIIPRNLIGQPAVIIGTGPSLEPSDVELCRTRGLKLFGVNNTWEFWPDVHVTVNPEWWDKCYMECGITPITAVAVEEQSIESGDSGLPATLNNGCRDDLDLQTLRLDATERLLCKSTAHGDVLFSDNLRFTLLRGVSEDLRSVEIGGSEWPLLWEGQGSDSPYRS